MLKISDFAQLSRVSPKTLHLYHRLGLLKPAKVDHQNNYRYYCASQLPRLYRILVFKELGFSLEQIGCLLDENISVLEIRGMLRLKQLEIQQRLSEDVARLATVKFRLEELEKEPTISHHLMKLKELNLVEMRSQGNTHLYKLNGDTLSSLNKSLFTSEQMANWTKDIPAEAWSAKVLRNYTNGDRLTEIPASRKKRLVILKWLVNKFDLGRTYTEKEVNEILKRYHPDSATLRREFIGYKLMKRDRGIYERLTENLWQSEKEIMKQKN